MMETGLSLPERQLLPAGRSRKNILRRMLGCTLMTLVLLTGAACDDEGPARIPELPLPDGRKHTIMVYLTGTSLLSFYTQNIEGMCRSVNEEMLRDNRIMICYQPKGRESALVKELIYDSQAGKATLNTRRTYTTFNAADPENVAEAFAFMQSRAPADSYGVIIGCHGKAWVPANYGALRIPGITDFEDFWKTPEGALPTRSIGDSRYELDITELAAILEGLEVRPEYLIFDACFMANIETLYDLRHSASYIVASPCEVMGIGFPYDQFTPVLLSGADAATKMKRTCENFFNYYNAQTGSYRSGCVSLTVTSEIDELARIMREINTTAKGSCDPATLQIYEALSSPLLFDFGHYVTSVCTDPALLAQYDAQMERAFPAEWRLHTDSFYSAYNQRLNPITYYTGISISEPSEAYAEENRKTNWYRATH